MSEEDKSDIQYKLVEKIEPSLTKKAGEKLTMLEKLTTPGFITGVVFLYVTILFVLLLSELGIIPILSEVRVTNQVVILFSLIFLPFFIIASSRLVHTISLRLSGQEIRIEMAQMKQETDENLERVEKDASRNVSTAEQALWPMLAGANPEAEARWQSKKIIIGSKLDISQVFFTHFLKYYLGKQVPEIECEVRVPNGGSLKNFADVKYGWVDLYIDFTGTCCQYFNINHKGLNVEQLVSKLNKFAEPLNMQFTAPIGATENYCIVIKRPTAEKESIRTLADLGIKSSELVFSADPEFLNRRDCYKGLEKEYGFDFKDIRQCKVSDRYAFLNDKDVHVFVGYETDPELKNRDNGPLLVLEDKEQFFPSYDALPLVNKGALTIPGLAAALDKLHNTFSTQEIINIVHKLSVAKGHNNSPESLAEEYYNKKFAGKPA